MAARFIWSCGCVFLLNIAAIRQCNSMPSVNTNIGVIKGTSKTVTIKEDEYKVNRYLGIPYAKPPVGELRFAKPEPAEKFESPYEATQFGASCPQSEVTFLPAILGEMSEDCLSLNVYVPDTTPDMTSGYAVMVWVHGGAFLIGSSNIYIADTLAAFGNVIVVTINYRLGLWGFLSTDDKHAPGNYGLWDQQLAFRWVQANIGAFGGDNNRVTIFGESAGGVSVARQAFYPPNKGLFQRVIAESGSSLMAGCFTPNPLDLTHYIAEKIQCETAGSEQIVACLRKVESDKLLAVLNEIAKDPENAMKAQFMPTKDNDFITFLPSDITKVGANFKDRVEFFRSIDVINGVNLDEGAVYLLGQTVGVVLDEFTVSREEMNTKYIHFATMLAALASDIPATVVDMILSDYTNWRGPDDPELLKYELIKLVGDIIFNVPSIALSQLHANESKQVNSYVYEFRPRPSISLLPTPSWVKGANHGDEIGFVFGFDTFGNTTTQPWEHELSHAVMTYWTNFAKTGNPNKPSNVVADWPKYNMENQKYLALEKEMTNDSSVGQFLHAREVNFWLKTIPSVIDAITHAHGESSPFSTKTDDSCKAGGECDGQ